MGVVGNTATQCLCYTFGDTLWEEYRQSVEIEMVQISVLSSDLDDDTYIRESQTKSYDQAMSTISIYGTCFCIMLQNAVLALPSLRVLANFWRASSSVEAAFAPSSNSPPADE